MNKMANPPAQQHVNVAASVIWLTTFLCNFTLAAQPAAPPSPLDRSIVVHVVDRRGRPLENATIGVLQRIEKSRLRLVESATTDENGRQRLTFPAKLHDATLMVHKDGFQRVLFRLGKETERFVALGRIVSQENIVALTERRDNAQEQEMLFNLMAEENHAIFPYIGQLRPCLIPHARKTTPDGIDQERRATELGRFGLEPFEPSERARDLLRIWGDERDSPRAAGAISGTTVNDVIDKWTIKQWPGLPTGRRITYSAEKDRALVTWSVKWRTGMEFVDLLVVKKGDSWQLAKKLGMRHFDW